MTGWAATKRLRSAVTYAGHATNCASVMLNEPCDCNYGRAVTDLALVEAALDAAADIEAYDALTDRTSPSRHEKAPRARRPLGAAEGGVYALVRRDEIAALAAALRAVREGA